MDPLIVGQARNAGLIDGLTVDTLGVISLTRPVGEEAKGVLADAFADGCHCKIKTLKNGHVRIKKSVG